MTKITKLKQIGAVTLSAILLASVAFLVLDTEIKPAYGTINVKKGSFAKPEGSAPETQSINVGFSMSSDPSVLILWTTKQTSEGSANQGFYSFGFSDGTNTASIAIASDDNALTSNTNRRASTTDILQILDDGTSGPGSTEAEATVSFTSTGFDLTWDPNDDPPFTNTAYLIHYYAMSGLTNVDVGSFQANTTTGSEQTINLGSSFTPDIAMFMGIGNANSADPTNANANAHWFFGAAKSSTSQWAVTGTSEDGRDTSDTWHWQRTDACILELAPSTGNVDAKGKLDSFNLGNIKIDWDDAPSAADYMYYLAIKGGNSAIGSFTPLNQAAPYDQNITGLGFQPVGLLAVSVNEDSLTDTAADFHHQLTVGAAGPPSTDSTEGTIAFSDEDSQGTTDTYNRFNSTRVVMNIQANAGGIQNTAEHKSFDSDGFTWHWTAFNNFYKYFYIAFG